MSILEGQFDRLNGQAQGTSPEEFIGVVTTAVQLFRVIEASDASDAPSLCLRWLREAKKIKDHIAQNKSCVPINSRRAFMRAYLRAKSLVNPPELSSSNAGMSLGELERRINAEPFGR